MSITHHVLYVEGDRAQRESVAAALLSRHRHLQVAQSVSEALQVAESRTFWCGFLANQELADGEGLALIQELRKQHRDVPAALTTGDLNGDLANRCFRAGVGYMAKPFGEPELDAFFSEVVSFSKPPTSELTALFQTIAATRRERDVIRLSLVEVKMVCEIAEELSLSVGTVKSHIQRILAKSQAGSMRELRGWLPRTGG